jgi:hypothetical protein
MAYVNPVQQSSIAVAYIVRSWSEIKEKIHLKKQLFPGLKRTMADVQSGWILDTSLP